MPGADAAAIERTYRESSGRAVATLVRFFGDIDLAEEAVQEAFTAAAERWPAAGVPPNPGGWIVTTARNKALDRLRRESSRYGHEAQAALLRATKLASAPSARATGLNGWSCDPNGVDLVTLPCSLVGEYWPFVRP